MCVDKDGSPLGKLSERLAVLPVRKARRKELSALVDRAVKLEEEKEELRIECNRLYGIGQDYDEDVEGLRERIAIALDGIANGYPTDYVRNVLMDAS